MIEEQKHILEYLKEIIPTIWDNLDDYAKENSLTNLPYSRAEELLADIENDVEDDYYLIGWYFLDVLSYRTNIGNLLKELLVHEDNDYCVYNVNDKYIKVWYDYPDPQFKFVSKEDAMPSETIEYLKTITEQLKKREYTIKTRTLQN